MNKKAFSLAIILSMATTGAFASDVVSTSVNNGDKLTKLQKEAIQLTQQQLAQKASQDAQQYEVALNLMKIAQFLLHWLITARRNNPCGIIKLQKPQ